MVEYCQNRSSTLRRQCVRHRAFRRLSACACGQHLARPEAHHLPLITEFLDFVEPARTHLRCRGGGNYSPDHHGDLISAWALGIHESSLVAGGGEQAPRTVTTRSWDLLHPVSVEGPDLSRDRGAAARKGVGLLDGGCNPCDVLTGRSPIAARNRIDDLARPVQVPTSQCCRENPDRHQSGKAARGMGRPATRPDPHRYQGAASVTRPRIVIRVEMAHRRTGENARRRSQWPRTWVSALPGTAVVGATRAYAPYVANSDHQIGEIQFV